MVTLDLGAVFWVDYLRTMGCCYGYDPEVHISDGRQQANGELAWELLPARRHEQTIGELRAFERAFVSPLRMRFLTYQLILDKADLEYLLDKDIRIREFQLFGEGAVSEVILTSPLIELPETAILNTIAWEADIPDSQRTGVEIRTRSGDWLIEETAYYGISGQAMSQANYDKAPSQYRGPVVTRQIPGGGWSAWSQPYRRSGERIASPSPRRFLQIQVKLYSQSPAMAPGIHSLWMDFRSSLARQARAEIWPERAALGNQQLFELYLQPTFVERQPGGSPSRGFDQIRIDAAPMEAIELVDVGIGSETDYRLGTAQVFSQVAWRTDAESGEQVSWFADEAGRRFQALIDPDSGDTLKVLRGRIDGTESSVEEAVLLLHLAGTVSPLSQGEGIGQYNRVVLDDGEQVPVDEKGRVLNEIGYYSLPEDKRGRVLYFSITGNRLDGTTRQDTVRISVKVATCSGLKVATDRSVATGDFKLTKSGHFGSSFSGEKVDFQAAPAQRSRFGMAVLGWIRE